ncbi:MAG: hypothetical protein NTZ61_06120 [Proteobacteria bacterium]|nr:hypothetical protein [Pseudomonadota bacterium]
MGDFSDVAHANDLTLLTGVSAATRYLAFTYGTPFDLSAVLHLDLYTSANRATFPFTSATFLHSANLNGIARVHDSLGNPVNDFTISADSGADYTKPFSSAVPEPDNASLPALVGLAVLGFMRRRRAA